MTSNNESLQRTANWNARYQAGDIPWEETNPSSEMEYLFQVHLPAPAHVLEIGCGLGTNAIRLALLGYHVRAVDIAETAIQQAQARGRAVGVAVDFAVADIMDPTFVPPTPMNCVFDKGCFHSYRTPEGRLAFAARVAALLPPGGLWLNISGSTDHVDDPAICKPNGHPRLTATELLTAIEPYFQLQELHPCWFGQTEDAHFLAWGAAFRRR